jgi:hypothetical protein
LLKKRLLKNQPPRRNRVSHASRSGKDDDARVCRVGRGCVVRAGVGWKSGLVVDQQC